MLSDFITEESSEETEDDQLKLV